MSQSEILSFFREKSIQSIFQRAGIVHLWLFGSYARNTAHNNSDIDLMYEYDASKDSSF